MKIACFYDFLGENQFVPTCFTQNNHLSIFEGVFTK